MVPAQVGGPGTLIRAVGIRELSPRLISKGSISETLSRVLRAGAPHARKGLLSELSWEKVN